MTPGATSSSRSIATRLCSLTRPCSPGSAGGGSSRRVEVVRPADGRHLLAHHRGVVVDDLHAGRDVRVLVPRVLAAPLGARGGAGGHDRERARDRQGRGAGEKLATAQRCFRHA